MNDVIKVLIVEDDLKVSELHKRFTEKIEGFEVIGIANTLDDAKEMVTLLEPKLVLLDLFFPEGSGMDFLKEMRGKGLEIDIILITASKDAGSLQDALRGGAFDYIVKPVIFERFKNSLNRYKDYIQELSRETALEQKDIDQIVYGQPTEELRSIDMPKGIDPLTLKKMFAVLDQYAEDGISAEEAGKQIGASRNTARRYLEFMKEEGHVYADIVYGNVGRPERKFFKK